MTLLDTLLKWKKDKTSSREGRNHFREPMTSKDFRSGNFTVTICDEDLHILKIFTNCTNLQENQYDIKFNDELGMYRSFVGFSYTIEERP